MTGDPHKQAAYAYGGLGVLVILITFLGDLVPAERSGAKLELAIGALFIALFALLIYRGWWVVSAVLTVSNSWRVFTYFNDGRGLHVQLLPLQSTRIEPQPLAFLNAGLMLLIVLFLARSALAGWNSWKLQHAG